MGQTLRFLHSVGSFCCPVTKVNAHIWRLWNCFQKRRCERSYCANYCRYGSITGRGSSGSVTTAWNKAATWARHCNGGIYNTLERCYWCNLKCIFSVFFTLLRTGVARPKPLVVLSHMMIMSRKVASMSYSEPKAPSLLPTVLTVYLKFIRQQ